MCMNVSACVLTLFVMRVLDRTQQGVKDDGSASVRVADPAKVLGKRHTQTASGHVYTRHEEIDVHLKSMHAYLTLHTCADAASRRGVFGNP